ncbi:sensor histidine kinase [Paenibacillus sp. 79R4]|uniref:sensor histidine kinase n=1 Tax=Paenibacillus sp. 79R4 TaxID=2212847 RepID=UPI00211958C5|nr:histidine kinase [Paenibacillus sp. 79R4]
MMIIRLMKSRFNDLKFRSKLLLSHLTIVLIPILLLGMLSFLQSYTTQINELNSEARSGLSQMANILDYKINRYNMLCEFIVLNRDFSQIFLKNYQDNYFNMYLDFRDTMDPLLSQIKLMDGNIEEITFYTSGDLLGIRDHILPLHELKRQPWYDGDRGRRWIIYDGHVYLLQQLISNHRNSNFMVITINYESIFSSIEQVSDHISVSIEDSRHKLIYQGNQDVLTARSLTDISGSLQNIDWTLKFSVSHDNAYMNALTIFKITFFVIVLSLLIAFSLIYVFSSSFTRRIVHLRNKVDKVEQNNLEIIIQSSSRDEIGELTNGIGKMLGRIKSLISQVYEAESAKRESEYSQLIAQINPHFLYNTLSFIHWRSVKKQDIETGYMVAALAQFYRTTLNKGKALVTIKDELANIKAYIDLQLIMHDASFEIDYKVEESLLNHHIIHFILQPIVENAIKHGFAEPLIGDRLLNISVYLEKGEIKMKVEDNGIGMSSEQEQKLLTASSSGYGVKNVNDRIKLYYGTDYGLDIFSNPGQGTKVMITLPYNS